jgi:hypothetical protein
MRAFDKELKGSIRNYIKQHFRDWNMIYDKEQLDIDIFAYRTEESKCGCNSHIVYKPMI